MGDCFYLAIVKHEGRLNQGFSISGRAAGHNLHALWELCIDILHGTQGCTKRAAIVAAVKIIEQTAVFRNKCNLGGCRTGVDTEETFSFVGGKVGT